MGLVIGLLGLVYLGITGGLTDCIFGDPRIDTWSGDWWWIPFIAAGGLVAAAVRSWLKVTDQVPGGVAVIDLGTVDHKVAPSWILLSAVSAVAGASLGPSFALVMLGGGLGSWIASKRWPGDEAARLDTTMAGVSGGFGGAFTFPGLGTLIVSELAPTPKDRYIESVLPQLFAATVAFAVFFGVVGTTFLNSFAVPVRRLRELAPPRRRRARPRLERDHDRVRHHREADPDDRREADEFVPAWCRRRRPRRFDRVVLPLTIGAGNDQLTTVIDESASISIWLLVAVLVGKMLAMAISLATGSIGGNVLPMLFVGGTAGVVAHLMFPDIPYAIAVGCMLAAVPGATIKAPVGLTFIAVLAVGLGPLTVAPVVIAVATAYLTTSSIVALIQSRRVDVPEPHT